MITPSVSIVINTLNRGAVLEKTLQSLVWLRYRGDFEVIVVNGPSTDNTQEILSRWRNKVRIADCPAANLSMSRNIGISMAQGDIIAFIDDDAIPEPEWLEQLIAAYADPSVGAVGGFVYDHTGYNFQYKYCTVDRFGNADLSATNAAPHYSFPKSYNIPHLLGCNSSFRRDVLLQVGGFDEEYEYFLDETDLCTRIVDAGYLITQLPNAYVHHKYAPSNIRGENKATKNRFPIVKNKVYFILKHSLEFHSMDRALEEINNFITDQKRDVLWCKEEGLLSTSDAEQFSIDVSQALELGLQRGLQSEPGRKFITGAEQSQHNGSFLKFEANAQPNAKNIVLISKDFPPDYGGGIAVFTRDLAQSLARNGNIVHVVTQSHDINRVDFENGVWIHRILIRECERYFDLDIADIPRHIWDWSASALEEVKRIQTHRAIDVVEAPIWDCEGIAFLLDRRWPLVTSLHTTLHFWLNSHPEKAYDKVWMENFGLKMLAGEKLLMQHSDAIRANSRAIVTDIENAYDFKFNSEKLLVVPHGLSKIERQERSTDDGTKSHVEILFVGRLEARKGIDVLLEAIPTLLENNRSIFFRIIGDNSLLTCNNKTHMEKFTQEYQTNVWFDQVIFEGKVTEDRLIDAYETCDIFVAPSRFESFGLIYLEAMRAGKPVVGTNVGGVSEVVTDELNGYLIEPDNVFMLVEALQRLIDDEELRRSMGAAGHEIYLNRFTSERMAIDSVDLYRTALEQKK